MGRTACPGAREGARGGGPGSGGTPPAKRRTSAAAAPNSRGGQHDPRQQHQGHRRPLAALFATTLLLCLLLATSPAIAAAAAKRAGASSSSSWGRWRRAPAPAPRPAARLFHDDEGSLAWDAPALKRLRAAARGDHLRDLDAFLRAPSLAAFLGLDPVEALHVPLPVNVVLVGFQGDGHAGVDLPAGVVREWLARGLDHVIPHTRVSLAELSCAEDGHCLGRLDAASAARAPSPLPSAVRLNASVTVASVARGEVLAAFERAIAAFSRPSDPAEPAGAQQVDALKMDAFVESFVEALGLADGGYTLLVLNPSWSAGLASYAYRAGFTAEEIEQLHGQLELLHEVSRQAPAEEPSMARVRPPPLRAPRARGVAAGAAAAAAAADGGGGDEDPLTAAARQAAAARFAIATGEGGPRLGRRRKFRAVDAGAASALWAKAASAYLREEEDHKRELIRLVGPRTMGGAAAARAVSLLRQAQGRGRWALPSLHGARPSAASSSATPAGAGLPPGAPTASVAARYAEEGRLLAATLSLPPDHVHNPDLRASHPLEDCATPTWVGLGRWIMLDLTARRADWGPALGGDGVVTEHTLPDVADAMAPVVAAREDIRDRREVSEHELSLHARLDQERDASRAAVENAQAHARGLREQAAASAGGAPPPLPQLDADGNPILSADTVAPATPLPPPETEHEIEQRDARNEAAVLRAELDAVERFAMQHCRGRADPPPACEDAKEAATELWHDLLLRSTSAGHAVHGGHREHRWDIFGDLALAGPAHAAAMAPAAKRAAGRLLPHLAAVLSSGLRHAVAPPSATWHHRGYLHDTASPYARRVRFRLHLVRDGTRQAAPGTRAAEKLGLLTGRARPGGDIGGGGNSIGGGGGALARPPPYLSLSSFDVAAFRQQVSRLALPKQAFEFEVVDVSLHDEPGLAAAFAASTRGAFASVPHAVDDPVESEAIYVDSRELAARLRSRFGGPSARGLGGGGRGGGAGGGPALRRVHFNADADPTGFFGGGADVWSSGGKPGGGPGGGDGKFGAGADEDSASADGFGGFGGGGGGGGDGEGGDGRPANPHAVLDVPVFVFMLDRPHPVLLDAHYNARALEDMVLAVSNAAHEDEPPLGISCDGYLLSRPPSPLRHTLAAVLQHLGGVLPPHLGYRPGSSASSPYDDAAGDESDGGAGLSGGAGGGGGGDGGDAADNGGAAAPGASAASAGASSADFSGGRIEHDWLWATGAHPLAWTGTGASYSQLSVDALHRSYVLDALDASVDAANRAVARLDAGDARRRRVAAAQALMAREDDQSAAAADGAKSGHVPSMLEEWADALAAGDEHGLVAAAGGGAVRQGKDRARARRRRASRERHGGELLLEREHAHLVAHAALARRALAAYSDLAELWRLSAARAAALDFGPAAEAIPRLERAARAFERACAELETALFPRRCAARHGQGLPPGLKWGAVLGAAAAGAAVASLALGLPRYAKLRLFGKHGLFKSD